MNAALCMQWQRGCPFLRWRGLILYIYTYNNIYKYNDACVLDLHFAPAENRIEKKKKKLTSV